VLRNSLTQLKAKSASEGKYADGQGLWLFKTRREAGKWVLRVVIDGKRREMGLGRWPDVSIAEARGRAETARRKVRDGIDPIEGRTKKRRRTERLTVSEAVQDCYRHGRGRREPCVAHLRPTSFIVHKAEALEHSEDCGNANRHALNLNQCSAQFC